MPFPWCNRRVTTLLRLEAARYEVLTRKRGSRSDQSFTGETTLLLASARSACKCNCRFKWPVTATHNWDLEAHRAARSIVPCDVNKIICSRFKPVVVFVTHIVHLVITIRTVTKDCHAHHRIIGCTMLRESEAPIPMRRRCFGERSGACAVPAVASSSRFSPAADLHRRLAAPLVQLSKLEKKRAQARGLITLRSPSLIVRDIWKVRYSIVKRVILNECKSNQILSWLPSF
jgi:hypothetical protein